MAATTDTVQIHQPNSDPHPKNVQKTFWTDTPNDTKLSALAAVNDCSQGALLRSLIDDAFAEQFDDLDPQFIDQGHVSVDELHALATDDTTVDHLALESEIDECETAETETVAEYEPDSYYLTVTPDDLAEPGPELEWETLRDAVKNPEDGGYWNDELEIHDSRVGEETLKASHRPAARILTALAHSNAYENGILPKAMIDDLVETYCLHLTNRVTNDEQERGKEHIRETYRALITDHLYENPSPTANSYYCSKTQLQTRLQAEVDTAQAVAECADTITDFDAWKEAQEMTTDADTREVTIDIDGATDDEVRRLWHSDLVSWVEDLARAKHVGRRHAADLRSGDYDSTHVNGDTETTAFNALHANLHDARAAFDELSADVKVEVIEALDDALLAVITSS
ncbi:hypothetical protein [Haladaptatus halobius]|uniref:hypothetical protein n=1 Tax=Haladaptatus halobius TaxID=2884875 RepID=UPI001D0A81C6|nr:hypothetical protein [Haladaptatus halobius]